MPQGIGQTGEGTSVGSQAGQKRRVRKGGDSPIRTRPRPAAPAAAPTAAASPEPSASDMAQLMQAFANRQSGSTADSTQQPAPRGVRGVAQNLFGGLKKLGTGNVSAGLGQMANAFNPLAARSADAAAAAQAQQRTEKPESSDAKEFTTAEDFASGLEKGPVKTQLEKVIKALNDRDQAPNKHQTVAIHEVIEQLNGKQNNHISDAIKKDLLNDCLKKIMKNKDGKIDVKELVTTSNNEVVEKNEKGQDVLEELKPCFMDDNGQANIDDDNNIKINRRAFRKFKNDLSSEQKKQYNDAIKNLPEALQSLDDTTQHLHFALLAATKSGQKINSKTLKSLIESAEKGEKTLPLDEFCDNLGDILGSKAVNTVVKEMTEEMKKLTPENDEERKKLKERMVGDNKLYSQEQWDKMSPAEKEQAYKAQKDEDRLLAQMPEQMRQQYQQMDPKQRRNMMEQAYGNGQPLGTPQSMQNRMTPEMQKKMMEESQKQYEAQQNATKQQNENQIKSIDDWMKNVTSTNNAMANGLASAAKSVSGIASMLSQMRQNQGQQFMNAAEQSMARQQKMLDKMGSTSSSSSSSY